ncbi:FxsA family protein [Terrilactibacillus laevilacticus]|nr:FxsA family protein [Terrilactibacillus laevilacticus]
MMTLKRWLLLLFLLPICDIILVIYISHAIGFLYTLLLLVASFLFGIWLIKRKGIQVFRSFQQQIHERHVPSDSLFDGLFMILGGLLLIMPGFLSDLLAFFMLFPTSRTVIKRKLARWLRERFSFYRRY